MNSTRFRVEYDDVIQLLNIYKDNFYMICRGDNIMGSPQRTWEHSEDIMEVDNLFRAFLGRDDIDILNGENRLYFNAICFIF